MHRVWNFLVETWKVLRDAGQDFGRDHATHYSAAMAFYAIFSVAPFILIATAIGGLVYGRAAMRTEVIDEVRATVGPDAAEFVLGLLENWQDTTSGIVATVVGIATALYFAFRVFDALRDTLNILWNVRLAPDISWLATFRKWAKSFLMMFLVGPIFLFSIVLSEVLTRVGPAIERVTGLGVELGQVSSFVISFGILTLMFAAIYKWLPDVEIAWRDVMFGAATTALLFSVGRALIGWYMAQASTASLFGAAGSLVVLLFWIYYSAQILFFGAEITEIYAQRFGRGIRPDRFTVDIRRIDVPSSTEEASERRHQQRERGGWGAGWGPGRGDPEAEGE